MTEEKQYRRGELNILFVGFPAHHPAVTDQGWDPVKVDKGLKSQLEELVNAGYSTKTVWFGPERGIEPMLESLKERRWDGVVVGFGVRGGNTLEVTVHFENIINGLRVHAPHARIMFNYNPTSTLEAVQRAFPLSQEGDAKPATNFGEHIYCDEELCPTAPAGWLEASKPRQI
ncbi:hypothetical protein P389DRAFT_167573 [Cystobasidium minutum MCA 4210]|uniref:uncharacterized protein n=1 Tax=Cystobasidium minutum MCA 4210 TaxID=1397322 RepID=UPI0034CF5BEB|eukprot:jgi/Rhomi1/167573/fgenesh1_kg.2_\